MSADLRQTILAEEELQASKRRFGLFSQAPPLAVGDDSYYKPTEHGRGQNGKPLTNPPQMLAGACRSGHSKSSFFSNPESIHQKDPYKDPITRDLQDQKKMHSRAKFHENEFKPASNHKIIDRPSYHYTEEKTPAKKPIDRDQMGKVRTQPRNFLTNSMKKIQSESFKPLKHMHDPYDRKKELQHQERENSRKKFQENMFRSMSHGGKTFQKDLQTYGEDGKAKMILSQRKQRSKSVFNIFPHEIDFKLARRGHGDPIGSYPKFLQKKTMQTITDLKLKDKSTDEKKQSWKPNNFGVSRPTPSIMFNPVSLKTGRYK